MSAIFLDRADAANEAKLIADIEAEGWVAYAVTVVGQSKRWVVRRGMAGRTNDFETLEAALEYVRTIEQGTVDFGD